MKRHKMQIYGAPDFQLIDWLHRGHNGGITFHTKSPKEEFKNLGAVLASNLKEQFSILSEAFEGKDSYFSINGYVPGSGKSRSDKTIFPCRRKADRVQYITSLFIDMDLYKAGISIDDAEEKLSVLSDSGMIPEPSFLLYSGRGMWAFWRLLEDLRPLKATPAAISAFKSAQSRLAELLSDLEADPNAKDLARITRVPGSINLSSGKRVSCRRVGERLGYKLEEISSLIQTRPKLIVPMGRPETGSLETPRKKSAATKVIPPEKTHENTHTEPVVTRSRRGINLGGKIPDPDRFEVVRAQKGKDALTKNRMLQWKTLSKIRRGYREGHRNHALLLFCVIYRDIQHRKSLDRSDEIPPDSGFVARKVGAQFKPPLTESECITASKWAYSGKRRFSDRKISDMLDITPEEESLLARKCGQLKSTWRRATKYYPDGQHPAPSPTRAQKQIDRRLLIKEFVESQTKFPTFRQIKKYLSMNSASASLATIKKDLEMLQLHKLGALSESKE